MIITKAAFARELGVHRSRVSRYVGDGMPARTDGQLDREAALAWLAKRERNLSANGSRGPAAAAKLARGEGIAVSRDRGLNARLWSRKWSPADAAKVAALEEFIGGSRAVIARAVREAGVRGKAALALTPKLQSELRSLADVVLGEVPGFRITDGAAGLSLGDVDPDTNDDGVSDLDVSLSEGDLA